MTRTSLLQKLHTIAFTLIFASTALFAEQRLTYTVLQEAEHHKESFTQGLYLTGSQLYESSGLYGRSFIQRYDVATNKIQVKRKLPGRLFAEGLTLFNNQIYLLTWKAGVALVLDPVSLVPTQQLSYAGEGWGITHTPKYIITSDGSSKLNFRDPQNFEVTRSITVHNQWRRYKNLNELEYAEGAIWANVWQSDLLLKISPKDGTVLGTVNLSALRKQQTTLANENVLNGIAYDPEKKAFWVTGKFWPKRYLIKITEVN